MIQVLDQHTIDKIAAGEVVERPASVVKELVENAVDSGATAITVEIKEGGISFIRVTDNGCGIPADQVPTAFLRHATSKITRIEDLLTVSSLGFRGEALSSIAAVGQVELITKTADAFTGVRYEIHGGAERAREEIGCPEGTTILVRNLFYNTPARRKFLKTAMTEGGYVSALVEQIALSRPDISFKLVVNGQNKLNTSGNGSRKEILYHIYGRDIAANLLPIDAERDDMRVAGFVAKPYVCRGNRSFEHYFVNGRYIKSPVITRAIEEAYKTFVMIHKFPFVALDITVDSSLLDVNVHPRKMEMRYGRSDELYQFLFEEIRHVLLQRELIPETSRPIEKKPAPENRTATPEPFETKRRTAPDFQSIYGLPRQENAAGAAAKAERSAVPKTGSSRAAEAADAPQTEAAMGTGRAAEPSDDLQKTDAAYAEAAATAPSTAAVREANAYEADPKHGAKAEQISLFASGFLTEEARPRHRLIGQLFRTYWLIEYEDSLFIMDQHAAHEKVLYEKLLNQYQNRQILSQQVDPPLVLSVSAGQQAALREHWTQMEELGFRMESFGGKEYLLRAVPLETYGLAAQDLFIDLIDALPEEGSPLNMDLLIYRIATTACKAAVKGNQTLTTQEADALIDQLLQLNNPYNCPHGRPTLIAMTKTELEKKFKRIQDKD